ncbi:MAG: hypothetical protein Tsb0013_03870 [Phycisphaerales bacterium]
MLTTIALSSQPNTGFADLIPEDWLPGAMLAAGIALVTMVMLRIWWKRRKRSMRRDREEAELSPKARMERIRAEAQRDDPAGSTLRKMMVDAQELTRACSAQLDTKAARLEALIEEANATLAKLEAAQRGAEASPAMRHATGPVSDRGLESVGFPMDRQRVRTRPDAVERSLDASSSPGLGDDPTAQRVMDLARRGYTPVQIAQELGEQVGRVELMLALRRA